MVVFLLSFYSLPKTKPAALKQVTSYPDIPWASVVSHHDGAAAGICGWQDSDDHYGG